MRAASGHDDVLGRDVSVDNAQLMHRSSGLAEVKPQGDNLALRQPPALGDQLPKALAGDKVINHHELVGHLVDVLDVGKARAVAVQQRRPDATAHQPARHLLAHEGTLAPSDHKLGYATLAASQHALDDIRVIYAQGVHDLLVVQTHTSSWSTPPRPVTVATKPES